MDCRADICRYLTENRKKLLNIIQKYEADPQTAEDVLSVAAVHLMASSQGYQGAASVATYVTRVVKNQAVSHVRNQVRRKTVAQIYFAHEMGGEDDDTALGTEEPVDERTPEQYAEHRQMLQRIEAVLPILQERFPTTFPTWKLYRLDGLDYPEIEARTGTPHRLAFLHVFRVGQALEQLLAKKSNRPPAALAA
jgi:RNA polymerase sigma factor (sigma-70 family)